MLKDLQVIQDSARIAAKAADKARRAYVKGRVEHEPDITDRMLAAIESSLDGTLVKDLVWEAKTLTSRGPTAQETQYGADFMGVLDIDLPQYKVIKGFLAQAKRIEPGERLRKDDRSRMIEQCEKMLSYTCASFMFIYSHEEFRVAPAIAVLASEGINPWGLYPKAISTFFELHFESFLGDRQIKAATPEALRNLSEDLSVRRTLWLRLRLANA